MTRPCNRIVVCHENFTFIGYFEVQRPSSGENILNYDLLLCYKLSRMNLLQTNHTGKTFKTDIKNQLASRVLPPSNDYGSVNTGL